MSKSKKVLFDAQFLDALRQNDSAALESLYREVFPQVANFILQHNGNVADAQDVFQETVLVTLRYLRKPDFVLTAQLNTFMMTIAKNHWFKYLRREKSHLAPNTGAVDFQSTVDIDVEGEAIAYDRRAAFVMEALQTLNEECKRLLLGFYFYKMSMQQLAAELGYTEGFVRVKKVRCMSELRKKSEAHPDFNV